jgi:muramoyltetrapeptide carboxypeptidase LdcA involved in peptidoglycan recycling
MKSLIKPKKLQPGDKIATISLSWGGAGEIPYRYEVVKKRLQEIFGLQVVETKHALRWADFISANPQARAEDLMEAFSDPTIKGILSNIGGDDSIRLLPFIDLSVIRNNPKVFLGFSDTTVTHFSCYKAGLSSFYGTSVLVGFAENVSMQPYQVEDIKKTLFSSEPIGQIQPSEGWTSERLEWFDAGLQNTARKLIKSAGWNFLQGNTTVSGALIGGCVEVLEFLKGTDHWIEADEWTGAIMFLETSETMIDPQSFKWILRNYAAQGIFHKIKGLIVGRPYHNKYVMEYNAAILKVIRDEQGLSDLPIITEMDFGHTCPAFTIPYGAIAEINCQNKSFTIRESGVTD